MARSSKDFFAAAISRLGASKSIARIQKHVSTLVDIPVAAKSAVEALTRSADYGRLNGEAQTEERLLALSAQLKTVERARLDLRKIAREAEAAIPALTSPDRTDVVGELQRQELRALVRAMPDEKRAAPGRLPPAMQEAILAAPAEASGVPAATLGALRDQLTEVAYPEQVLEARLTSEGVEIAEQAARDAERAIREAAGFENDTSATRWTERVLEPLRQEALAEAATATSAKEDDETIAALLQRFQDIPHEKRGKLVDDLQEAHFAKIRQRHAEDKELLRSL